MNFKILGRLSEVETFAIGTAIRELDRLKRIYGPGRWRKRKGVARIQFDDATIRRAEIHWYEATGIGRREYKIKAFLD